MTEKTLVHDHLFLMNTLARRKEMFLPRQGRTVRLFTCGPSLYRRQHLGNYRSFVYEDVLERYLELLGHDVRRVINFTDMEDKGIAEARDTGKSLAELVRPVEEAFYRECDLLKVRLSLPIPRATTSVESAVSLIKTLLDRKVAYRHQGDIFFDPLKYRGFGRLFGLDMSRWPSRKKRFRKDTYPGQRWNLGDFILWHGYRESDGNVFWETDLGKGRPSWNVQDAGMIAKHLGFAIDIHTGGVDNLYRHHDYTLAIMEAASGKEFCPTWLHGEHLLVDGVKMSKSKGNIVYPGDLKERGYDPRHIRFFLMDGAHYRKKLDLSRESLLAEARRLDELRELAKKLTLGDNSSRTSSPRSETLVKAVGPAFRRHLNDDLNVRGAVDELLVTLKALDRLAGRGELGPDQSSMLRQELVTIDQVLQVIF